MKKPSNKNKKKTTAKKFDALFDSGSDKIDGMVEWDKARLNAPKVRRVNVDFPEWVIRRMDDEATRRGVSRQALIKTWVYEKVKPAA